MAQTDATHASTTVKDLREGHVIRVPQYANPLEVTKTSALNGEQNAYIALEFADNPTGTDKTLIVNEVSGRVYLLSGSTSKGEVTEIEIVATPTDDESEHDESDATALAAELEAREDVRRATADWDGFDVAAVVADETDPGPLRDEYDVVGMISFDAASYRLFTIDA